MNKKISFLFFTFLLSAGLAQAAQPAQPAPTRVTAAAQKKQSLLQKIESFFTREFTQLKTWWHSLVQSHDTNVKHKKAAASQKSQINNLEKVAEQKGLANSHLAMKELRKAKAKQQAFSSANKKAIKKHESVLKNA